MTEDGFVLQLGRVDQIVCLVDRLHEHRVKFVLLLAQLDSVVNSVFDLANHVQSPLKLEVLQAHLYRIESIH